MSADRHYSPIDRFLLQADSALRTLLPFQRPAGATVAGHRGTRWRTERGRHPPYRRLMRINHTGEVCAQALYQGSR
ncbi:ubiquinone biosynthesis protein [Pseudomonas aeruginosa]|nr:ubiquinone biosynthesis protein [Pseudomonas aeruginosa]